jgi:hypothetical protein
MSSTTTSSEFDVGDKIDSFMKSTIFKYLMILVGGLAMGAAIYDYSAQTNYATSSLSSLGFSIMGAGALLFIGRHDKTARRFVNSSLSPTSVSL